MDSPDKVLGPNGSRYLSPLICPGRTFSTASMKQSSNLCCTHRSTGSRHQISSNYGRRRNTPDATSAATSHAPSITSFPIANLLLTTNDTLGDTTRFCLPWIVSFVHTLSSTIHRTRFNEFHKSRRPLSDQAQKRRDRGPSPIFFSASLNWMVRVIGKC